MQKVIVYLSIMLSSSIVAMDDMDQLIKRLERSDVSSDERVYYFEPTPFYCQESNIGAITQTINSGMIEYFACVSNEYTIKCVKTAQGQIACNLWCGAKFETLDDSYYNFIESLYNKRMQF